ncbi:MAG: hypothetical protein CMC38_07120 [Flavobacteriaceae bacterium]|nr:hypothetical protein [Flavobacteriaceae bacterium]|tara:strand:+ start:163 stop:801 length:639 start_codon:yes stop_codon:yes gene_type:complete
MYLTNIEKELKKIKSQSSINYKFKIDSFYDFNLNLLESKNIFHINDIKKTCIDYRLRFLNSKYFKGNFPLETKEKINNFKYTHRLNNLDLKVMAPSKLFKLENADDPLLFCSLGNDYFYLIDKWGNDLNFFRKIFMWPFKNFTNILIFLIILSFITTLLIPNGVFVYQNSPLTEFFITYLFILKSIIAVFIFFGFSLGKNFNTEIWNRKYFN